MHESVRRAVVQREKCPETGRLHYQGFLELVSPMRFNAIKGILRCDSAHLEKRKGTPQQAWDYCTKEDTREDGPWEYGEGRPKGQGTRQANPEETLNPQQRQKTTILKRGREPS